jgi:hypothetical protein
MKTKWDRDIVGHWPGIVREVKNPDTISKQDFRMLIWVLQWFMERVEMSRDAKDIGHAARTAHIQLEGLLKDINKP